MNLNELGNKYLAEAESIRKRITGLRPLLEIYRGDELNTLKSRIWILYRLGKKYNSIGSGLLKLA